MVRTAKSAPYLGNVGLSGLSDRDITRQNASQLSDPTIKLAAKPTLAPAFPTPLAVPSPRRPLVEPGHSGPITDPRSLSQQISDTIASMERHYRLLARPDLTPEKRETLLRVKAGLDLILQNKLEIVRKLEQKKDNGRS